MVNYWLWVAKEDSMNDNDEVGSCQRWDGCDPDTEIGDYVLIYRVSPHRDIKYLGEISKDCFLNTSKLPNEAYYCGFKILSNFENELELKDMKDEPELVEWYPLKNKFHKRMFPVSEEYWKVLVKLIVAKNPSSKDVFSN